MRKKSRLIYSIKLGIGLATSSFGAPNTPSPAPKTHAGPKLMPTSDDIANDVLREKKDDDQAKEHAIASSLREGESVMVDGKRYLAFRSSGGTLLVPAASGDIKREDLDSARCSPNDVKKSTSEDAMVVGVERPLSDKYTAYAGIMAKVIRNKCGEPTQVVNSKPKLQPEAGVKWKNGTKNGGEDRIFVNPRGVGAGTSF